MWPRIAAEYALIAVCLLALSAWPSVLALWLAALVIGSRQHALGVIGHWALHRLTPQPGIVRWLCLAPLGIDPDNLRKTHMQHHRAISVPGVDMEADVVQRFAARWAKPRRVDLLLDALGLHVDESLYVLRRMTGPVALLVYAAVVATIWATLGSWAAAAWPLASATGLVMCHRLRARTEHDHIANPGATIFTQRPSLLRRVVYLPHHTWMHAEHHADPSQRVWVNPWPDAFAQKGFNQ